MLLLFSAQLRTGDLRCFTVAFLFSLISTASLTFAAQIRKGEKRRGRDLLCPKYSQLKFQWWLIQKKKTQVAKSEWEKAGRQAKQELGDPGDKTEPGHKEQGRKKKRQP